MGDHPGVHVQAATQVDILAGAARDIADYERLHQDVLSRIPGVSRIQSSFTLRQVLNRSSACGVLAPALRRKVR
jgi:DNA-binding Lrp family transcriptional regulator